MQTFAELIKLAVEEIHITNEISTFIKWIHCHGRDRVSKCASHASSRGIWAFRKRSKISSVASLSISLGTRSFSAFVSRCSHHKKTILSWFRRTCCGGYYRERAYLWGAGGTVQLHSWSWSPQKKRWLRLPWQGYASKLIKPMEMGGLHSWGRTSADFAAELPQAEAEAFWLGTKDSRTMKVE